MRIIRRNKKLSRLEIANERQEKIARLTTGKGLFAYKNNTKGTLHLSKKSVEGKIDIPFGGEWTGDSYFDYMVKNHEAILVKILQEPEVPKNLLTEGREYMEEQKLILDQPDTVTEEGQVEHVIQTTKKKNKKLTETPQVDKKDVLINEDPIEGVAIILD